MDDFSVLSTCGDAESHTNSDTGNVVYLFISHSMEIGGIETLLARMANSITTMGFTVRVLCPDGPVVESLCQEVDVQKFSNFDELIEILKSMDLSDFNHANIWISMPNWIVRLYWLPALMWKTERITTRIVSGIFHPNQIRPCRFISANFFKTLALRYALPAGTVYFMNDACKAAHAKHWGKLFDKWPVRQVFLPPPSREMAWKPRENESLKIVSIGRIARFKGYNYAAPAIIRQLEASGVRADWDIYGDGDDLQSLRELADNVNGENRVTYRGSIPYSAFPNIAKDSDLFIGMGTAALEAAQHGVPTILAVESNDRYCYGFLHQSPSDSIGEIVYGVEFKELTQAIVHYSKTNEQERIRLGNSCRMSVQRRGGGESAPFVNMFSGGMFYPTNNILSSYSFLARISMFLRQSKLRRI